MGFALLNIQEIQITRKHVYLVLRKGLKGARGKGVKQEHQKAWACHQPVSIILTIKQRLSLGPKQIMTVK